MALNTASLWLKIALGCLGLGTLLFIIGFSTNAWVVSTMVTTRYGLWTYYLCGPNFCGTFEVDQLFLDVHQWSVWYRATQVLECLGFACDVIALLVLVLYIFLDRLRKRILLVLHIILCLVAVLFMVIGIAVFGAEFKKHIAMEIGWSLGIAATGSIFIFAAGVVSVIELKS